MSEEGRVMMETITLVGGFKDGHHLEWGGGDIVECDYVEELPPVEGSTDRMIVGTGTALYRRSLETSTLFVYQP